MVEPNRSGKATITNSRKLESPPSKSHVILVAANWNLSWNLEPDLAEPRFGTEGSKQYGLLFPQGNVHWCRCAAARIDMLYT